MDDGDDAFIDEDVDEVDLTSGIRLLEQQSAKKKLNFIWKLLNSVFFCPTCVSHNRRKHTEYKPKIVSCHSWNNFFLFGQVRVFKKTREGFSFVERKIYLLLNENCQKCVVLVCLRVK